MFVERRHHLRFKLNLPVEVHAEGSDTPIHFTTSDISLGGCYIESMYPFPVGTRLELKLQASDTLLILAKIVTADPQFGNGIQFVRMLPEDHDALSHYLDSVAKPEHAESVRT
jgi:c-di-GMP-binding flagellar brake protein YcgR